MELKKDWSCELSRSNIYCSKTAEVITPFLLGKNGVNDSFRLNSKFTTSTRDHMVFRDLHVNVVLTSSWTGLKSVGFMQNV